MNFSAKNVLTRCLLSIIFISTSTQADVLINGLEGKAKENTLLLLSLNTETCATPAWKIKRLFEQADVEIDRSLRAFGYYQASLKKI